MSVEQIHGRYGVNEGYGQTNQPVSYRTGMIAHRTGVTAMDKLATPSSPTVADVATGGSLLPNTNYRATFAAGTLFGSTTCPTVASVTTANDGNSTHVVRITTTAVTGALHYDVFMSAVAAPLWVARITEAQRAAGVTVTAVGTVDETSPGANKIDVRVAGTGVAAFSVAPFIQNNAYVLDGITPLDCTGSNTALVQVVITAADLRSLPALNYSVFTQIPGAPTKWVLAALNGLSLLSSAQRPFMAYQSFSVLGASALVVAVDLLSGQGMSIDIYVDLL